MTALHKVDKTDQFYLDQAIATDELKNLISLFQEVIHKKNAEFCLDFDPMTNKHKIKPLSKNLEDKLENKEGFRRVVNLSNVDIDGPVAKRIEEEKSRLSYQAWQTKWVRAVLYTLRILLVPTVIGALAINKVIQSLEQTRQDIHILEEVEQVKNHIKLNSIKKDLAQGKEGKFFQFLKERNFHVSIKGIDNKEKVNVDFKKDYTRSGFVFNLKCKDQSFKSSEIVKDVQVNEAFEKTEQALKSYCELLPKKDFEWEPLIKYLVYQSNFIYAAVLNAFLDEAAIFGNLRSSVEQNETRIVSINQENGDQLKLEYESAIHFYTGSDPNQNGVSKGKLKLFAILDFSGDSIQVNLDNVTYEESHPLKAT